ncbi:MAG: hypothetical protein ABR501_13460, partial [Pyrinomonadaceae bacterium]
MTAKQESVARPVWRIVLVLVVAVAALTSAMNDLNRLAQVVTSARLFSGEWLDAAVLTVNAKSMSGAENSCSDGGSVAIRRTEEFRWKGRVPSGKAIEIKGINGDISAEPAAGDAIEVFATKKGRKSDPDTVKIQVVEHGAGVTICAIYPSDNPERNSSCGPH